MTPIPSIHVLARCFMVLVAVAVLSGCAAEAPKIQKKYYFPPLPERPRIEWLRAYSSQNDFPKSGFSSFLAAILGEEPPLAFDKPLDIKSTGDGIIYVTDPAIAKVFIYDLKNGRVSFLEAPDNFDRPVGLALDAEANVYVSDGGHKNILVFDRSGTLLRTLGDKKDYEAPGAIAIDQQKKRLYIADTKGHKIVVYDLAGKFLFSFGERGDADGKLNFPGPVAVNRKGEVIVGDTMNSRIQIFDSDGKFLQKFGRRGDGPADFQIIKGIAVDSDQNIYVTDGKGHKFSIYSPTGDYLLTVGALYSVLNTGREAAAGFVIPQGIDIDRNDTIYVVDQMNQRFQVFQYISDRYLSEHPIPGYEEKPQPVK